MTFLGFLEEEDKNAEDVKTKRHRLQVRGQHNGLERWPWATDTAVMLHKPL